MMQHQQQYRDEKDEESSLEYDEGDDYLTRPIGRTRNLSDGDSFSSTGSSSESGTSSSFYDSRYGSSHDDDDDDASSSSSSSYLSGESSSFRTSPPQQRQDDFSTSADASSSSFTNSLPQQRQERKFSSSAASSSSFPTLQQEQRSSSASAASYYSQSQRTSRSNATGTSRSTATSLHDDFYQDESSSLEEEHHLDASVSSTSLAEEKQQEPSEEQRPPRRRQSLEQTLTQDAASHHRRSPTTTTVSSLSHSLITASYSIFSQKHQQPFSSSRSTTSMLQLVAQDEEEASTRRRQRHRQLAHLRHEQGKTLRNPALEHFESNILQLGLAMEQANERNGGYNYNSAFGVRQLMKDKRSSNPNDEGNDQGGEAMYATTSNTVNRPAQYLLYGFEALLAALLQLSDELELYATFHSTSKTNDPNESSTKPAIVMEPLHAVFGHAPTLDRIFASVQPILQDYIVNEEELTMTEQVWILLARTQLLVRMLCDLVHRVGLRREWNPRSETAFVTLLELLDRSVLELAVVCNSDGDDFPEYQLTGELRRAWSRTGHVEELKTLYVTNDTWLFRQVCFEVLVSTDQWCPNTRDLALVCEVAGVPSEHQQSEGTDHKDSTRLAPMPPAASHVLDKIHGEPLPRISVVSSILRRLLPPHALSDPSLLDSFSTIRSTIRNPLGVSGSVNKISISSVPEVLNDQEAMGMGGVGKTTMAAMVASNIDVRRFFKDGVAWIYVGPEELTYARYTQCLRELVSQLVFYEGVPLFAELLHTPGESISKRWRREEGFMVYARDTIAELLHNRNVLIVVDNVLFESDLEWFNFEAPQVNNKSMRSLVSRGSSGQDIHSTGLLVTTRCRNLLPEADTVEIDLLEEMEAIQLLVTESGQSSDHVMTESKEARSVVRECANHPLAVKTVGRWLNLKRATAGVVNSVEEVHEDMAKSIDNILKSGDNQRADMIYEIMGMSFSPAVNGEPTNVIKACFAAFVTVFCNESYHSNFVSSVSPPMIPFSTAELLFETLLDLEEATLFHEGSLFYTQRRDATLLIPEALAALGVLKVITAYNEDADDCERSQDTSRGSLGEQQRYLQIMHYIQTEYGEFLSSDDESMRKMTQDAERRWNKAFAKAVLVNPADWDSELPDASRDYAVEMLPSHMLRAGMYDQVAKLLADNVFVRGRINALGRENAAKRHITDTELLFKLLSGQTKRARSTIDPHTAMKGAYQAIGGMITADGEGEGVEDKRARCIEAGRAHYEIGFSLAEQRCWQASIAHWESSQELLLSSLGMVEFVAAILYNVGVVYAFLNEYEKALASLKQCLRIRGAIHGEEHILYAKTIQRIGDVFLGMSDYNEAMESYQWCIDVMHIEPSCNRVDIGDVLDSMGSIHYSKGEVSEALRCYQDALRSKKVELGDDHPELSITYRHIGNCFSEENNAEQAITHFEEAIRLRDLDPEKPDERAADILSIEGAMNNLAGRQDVGLKCYEKSLEIFVTVVPYRKEKIASLLHLIGCMYLMKGEHKKAMKLFEESLQARRKVLGFVHLDVASTLFNMAFLHQSRGRLDKALKCLEEALKIRQLRLPNSAKVALTHEKIGTLSKVLGKTSKAEVAYAEALRIRKLIHGDSHESVATVLHAVGDLMDDIGRYDEAYLNYVDALDIRRKRLGPEDEEVAATLYSMGFTLHHKDQPEEALACFEEALSIRKSLQGENASEVGDILNTMGFLQARRGDLDGALSLLWDALRVRKHHKDHIKVSETLKNLGNVHREQQEYDLAIECYQECLNIRRSELGDDHAKVADALVALGNVNSDQDRIDDAMSAYLEAQKIRILVYGANDESVAAVSQYMGTMEFRSGDLDRARVFLEDFIRIRRENEAGKDGDYVNVLFMIGNIHKIQGDDIKAKRNWSEAYAAFQELGLAEENPQIAKVMNSLLFSDSTIGDSEPPRSPRPLPKKKRSGLIGSFTSRIKGSLSEEKMAKFRTDHSDNSSRRSVGSSRRSVSSSRRSVGNSRRSMRSGHRSMGQPD